MAIRLTARSMTNSTRPFEESSGEHRREHRQRVLKGGTIITSIQNSEVSCTLRNQNPGGAELKVAPESRVPDHFLLYVDRKSTRLNSSHLGISYAVFCLK